MDIAAAPSSTARAPDDAHANGARRDDRPPALSVGHPARAATRTVGWFASLVAHVETGLLVAVVFAPAIATFLTVLAYIDPLQPDGWRQVTSVVPPVALFPGILVAVWLGLGLPLGLVRLGTAARANAGSHAQLNARLLGFENYRALTRPLEDGPELDQSLDVQLAFVRRALELRGPRWVMGDGFISLWRQVDHLDALFNYVLPTYRVWARAQRLLLRLPASTALGAPDVRGQLLEAMNLLNEPATEQRGRASVAEAQLLIDSGRTDRYSGLLRARNIMLAACTMTALAVYALFWLGIVALPATPASQAVLGAALFFTTVGALVGLFQLLYMESRGDTGVDDYGLSIARILVAPQIAGLAALLGVVLTSLATSTLSGSPAAPAIAANTIPAALEQIRNPANVLVSVGFALSPGLVFTRFRDTVEQTKRELTRNATPSVRQP